MRGTGKKNGLCWFVSTGEQDRRPQGPIGLGDDKDGRRGEGQPTPAFFSQRETVWNLEGDVGRLALSVLAPTQAQEIRHGPERWQTKVALDFLWGLQRIV